ncbi:GWxTD domain-containing protein [Halocola ammonii]
MMLLIAFVAGCASTSNLSRNDQDGYHLYDLDMPHPDYVVYHNQQDSSQLHFQFELRQFLFTRPDPSEPFEANIRIEYRLFNSFDAEQALTSHAEDLSFTSNPKQPGTVNSFVPFSMPMGTIYTMEIMLIDQNRGARFREKIVVDKTENSSQFFLISDESDKVVFHNWFAGEEKLSISCDVNPPDNIRYYHYTGEIPLPPPPFSMVEVPPIDISSGKLGQCEKVGNKFIVPVSRGLFSFHNPENDRKLVSLWVDSEHFPVVGKLDQMIAVSRYIMSKSEFEGMVGHKERKAKMDAFWMENAGSKDRARDLIKNYYTRVEEANYYFTSHIPGWKTDRGLIHIIFGNPKKIFRGPDFEKWLYGEENNLNSLSFTFNRNREAISDNHYELARDMSYRTFWDRAVQSWRSGRIYNQ